MRLKFWQKKPANIYAELAASITGEADTGRSWCQGSYYTPDSDGTVSACLVGHVDLVLGTAFVQNGQVKLSTDGELWKRRHAIVNRLASLIEPETTSERLARLTTGILTTNPVPASWDENTDTMIPESDAVVDIENTVAPESAAEDVVTAFNDDHDRDTVLATVAQAAELYPND